ncbi:hypothetical protein F5Y07DRAFT_369086 [Xylaria sp. FL0933]|nr:hypothetical protein F5Y07DRAFT_369086 [Xylaria sp. FL0933]
MTSRRRALHWGRRNRRNLWRAWARYRMVVRVTVTVVRGPRSTVQPGQATSASLARLLSLGSVQSLPYCPPPRQLQASRRLGRGAKSSAKRPVGRSPMRLDGSSGRRWWVWMTRVPGWLRPKLYRFGGRRACSNCVFPARARGARGGFGTRSHAGCLLQTAEPPQHTRTATRHCSTAHCAACWLGPCCTRVP